MNASRHLIERLRFLEEIQGTEKASPPPYWSQPNYKIPTPLAPEKETIPQEWTGTGERIKPSYFRPPPYGGVVKTGPPRDTSFDTPEDELRQQMNRPPNSTPQY